MWLTSWWLQKNSWRPSEFGSLTFRSANYQTAKLQVEPWTLIDVIWYVYDLVCLYHIWSAPLYLFCTWQRGKLSERYIPLPNGTSCHGFSRAKDGLSWESRWKSWTHTLQNNSVVVPSPAHCSKQLNVATMEKAPRPITSPMMTSWLASPLQAMVCIRKRPCTLTVQGLPSSSSLGDLQIELNNLSLKTSIAFQFQMEALKDTFILLQKCQASNAAVAPAQIAATGPRWDSWKQNPSRTAAWNPAVHR